jgi:hypothetical protein
MSRILVACERSGVLRRALRATGHDAWSCDICPADDGSPYHITGNVVDRTIAEDGWDGLIAFPDCTYLARSGARWMTIPWRQQAQQWALAFAKTLWSFPIKRKALENPPGRLSTLWRKPDQIIQPHQFGHPEFKATCLWLDGYPPLSPTNQLRVPERGTDEWRRWNKVHYEGPGVSRQINRSRTYEGIALAMAEQWFLSNGDTA